MTIQYVSSWSNIFKQINIILHSGYLRRLSNGASILTLIRIIRGRFVVQTFMLEVAAIQKALDPLSLRKVIHLSCSKVKTPNYV